MSERLQHSHDLHFGDLEAGRVLTELMTEFPADTPVETVLQWLHWRLSLSEEESHYVGGFSASAERFQPTFTIDAMKLLPVDGSFTMDARVPVTPTDPAFIYAGAWFTGKIGMDAFIAGISPSMSYYHLDTFTNQQLNGWGDADQYGSYTYSSEVHRSRHAKVDIDTEPLDEVHNYRGQVYELIQTYPTTWLTDDGLQNKQILLCWSTGSPVHTIGFYQDIYFRGTSNYVRYIKSGVTGERLELYTDGVYRGQTSDVRIGTGFVWIKISALNNLVRVKWWLDGASEPSTWQITYTNASLTGGKTGFHFHGKCGNIVGPCLSNGDPWTHQFKYLEVKGVNTGPIFPMGIIMPKFTVDAWFSSGNDFVMDAFISPTFRIDAQIVEWIQGHFTIGAFRQDRVTKTLDAGAFIEGYATMDAVIADDSAFGNFTADAWKVITTTDDIVTDAVTKDIDRSHVITADAIRKSPDYGQGSFTVDAMRQIIVEPTPFDLDAWMNPGAHPPLDAVIFKHWDDKSFSADSWFWPADDDLGGGEWRRYRHFEPNAVVLRNIPGSVTKDGQIKAVRDEIAHYDEFERVRSNGWYAPSTIDNSQAKGSYTYYRDPWNGPAEMSWWYVSGGTGRHYDAGSGDGVYTSFNIPNDREVYLEFYFAGSEPGQPGGGSLRIGVVATNYLQLNYPHDIRLSVTQQYQTHTHYIQVDGATIETINIQATNRWMRFRASLDGAILRWKLWPSGSAEPDWTTTDLTAYWTPASGAAFIHHNSGNWFGVYGPWTRYYEDWTVKTLRGYPYGHKADAVFRQPDNEGSFTAGAHLIPEPFSMDAFVQPYFRADARIWLGTTFSADAALKDVITLDDSLIGYEHVKNYTTTNISHPSSWTHSPPEDAKYLIVSGYGTGWRTGPPSSATYGNVAMTYMGTYAGYIATYLWILSNEDWQNRDDDIVRTTGSGPEGVGPRVSTFLTSKHDIQFVSLDYVAVSEYTPGTYTMTRNDTIERPVTRAMYLFGQWTKSRDPYQNSYLYEGDGVANKLSQYTFWASSYAYDCFWAITRDGPDRTPITAGLVTTASPPGVAHLFGLTFQTDTAGPLAEAWINPGAHIPFSAQLTGLNIDAIIRRPTISSLTADASLHVFGEQTKSFVSDAYIESSLDMLHKSQFGWMMPGRYMWGDVEPETQQLHLTAGSWLAGTMNIDAIIDRGHFWADANIIWDDRLWYYENHDDGKPDEGRTENMNIFMWDNFS